MKKGCVSGENHPKAKLSDDEVSDMRDKYERMGLSYRECSEHYGCGESTARDIVKYRTRNKR